MTGSQTPAVGEHVSANRQTIEIFLAPGEFHFGDADTRIRTVLGSCVAITMWHPLKRIGGMCHYMLPTRRRKIRPPLDGRYADDAIAMFLAEIAQARTHPGEYEVKVFGGGNMFPELQYANNLEVGERNIEQGLRLLRENGFKVKSQDLAGVGHRSIVFELWSGDVWLRRGPVDGGD